MNRAHALLEVKSLDDEKRIIEGIATTPTVDRTGDVVEPDGAEFKLPIPLLWQHRSDQPIGHVVSAKVSKSGIRVRAQIARIEEEGPLKNRLDEAWQSIKSGLVRGLSIGFKGLETEQMEDSFGVRFLKWMWLELSAVTIPANQDASIEAVKSFDVAAPGDKPTEPVPAFREKKTVKLIPERKNEMTKTTAEKISAFEATRQAKSAAMAKIMEEAGEETLDASKEEEYDTLKGEVEQIDKHLGRLHELVKVESQAARPVSGETAKAASESRGDSLRVSVKQPDLPKGIAFARYAKCLALSSKLHRDPLLIAQEMYPNHEDLHQEFKTAVVGAGTGVTAFAGALVGSESSVFADFAEFLRPLPITGRLPRMRRVPIRTRLISQTASGSASWVGEGQPKPMQNITVSSTTLLPYKVATITVATMELLRDSSPSAEAILRDQLAQSVAAKIDTDFLDPQKGLDIPSGSPASISNGLTPISSTGRDADSVRTDLVAMFSAYISAANPASSAVWVMSAVTALQLSLMTNAFGQPEFPGLGVGGDGRTGFTEGTLRGIPVVTSEYLGYTTDSPVSGRDVFLVNQDDIYYWDDGGVDVRMSSEASLQMDDAPTNASYSTVAATTVVSMFQTNSVAFLAEKSVSWKRRRTEGVVHLQQVEWGENADSATQP